MNIPAELRFVELLKGTIGMQTFDRAVTLAHLLMQTRDVPGSVVEWGCYEGRTAMLLSSLTEKLVILYDSFQGLPSRSEHDTGREDLCPGALKSSPDEVRSRFYDSGMSVPVLVSGWFENDRETQLPGLISFAHIDSDYHDSTLQALSLTYLRLSPGAICVIDDYGAADLPGVRVAVDAFMSDKPEPLIHPFGVSGKSEHVYFVKA